MRGQLDAGWGKIWVQGRGAERCSTVLALVPFLHRIFCSQNHSKWQLRDQCDGVTISVEKLEVLFSVQGYVLYINYILLLNIKIEPNEMITM